MDHSHPADHTHGTFIHLECSKFSKDYTQSYLLVYLKCNCLWDLCRSELIGLGKNTVAIVAGIIAGVAVLAAACGAVVFIKRKAQQGKNVHVIVIIKAYCYHDCHCREY